MSVQATASSEGRGKRRRLQVHIITGKGAFSLYNLTVKEATYLRDMLDLLLKESAKA